MIEINEVTKSFEGLKAVSNVTLRINEKSVFGMIGTNGAGKSTMLRMIAGVLRQDTGTIAVDDMPVYDNIEAKKRICFISDEPYFFPNSTPAEMEDFYRGIYETFNRERFDKCLGSFGLDPKRKINTFSKGMKKQLAVLLGICSGTKYLLCDETFDGLDPVMRQGVKSMIADEIDKRGLTPVIASHNLRELEDICDHIGLLHKGGVLLSEDLEELKCNIQKVQCVFNDDSDAARAVQGLEIMKSEKRGSLYTYTIRGNEDDVTVRFNSVNPLFFEVLPLSLEEIFISETEVAGYDIKKIILG